MASNLLETIKAYFNNDVISKAASLLGESHGGIQKALSGIVPLILGGVLSKSNSGDSDQVLGLARNAATNNGGVLGSLQGLLEGNLGSGVSRGLDMIRGLFGDKITAVSNSISNYAGIKESSANSLLGLAAPVTLGKLGEYAEEKNLNAAGLSSFLLSQKEYILGAIPSGLGLGSLGLGALSTFGANAGNMTADVRDRTTSTAKYTETEVKRGTNWLWPLIILALLALALWYFLGKGCNNADTTTTTTTDTTTNVPAPPATVTPAITVQRTATKVKLVNGKELDAYVGGVEEKLVNCLNDAGCEASKDQWFDFDNINFELNSARLTAESQAQVSNIVAVLNAYPKAKIKIGGYTDKTGDDAANMKLSQERADAVLVAIRAQGGKADQLVGAEGYGSQQATVPESASDEERRKDRRISVQLREK